MPPARPWTTWHDVLSTLRRRWDDGSFLRGLGRGKLPVPVSVPVRQPTARQVADDFAAVQQWAQDWRAAPVAPARVELAAVGGRHFGTNSLPRRVHLDTADDLWRLLGVRRQVARFSELLVATAEQVPAGLDWVVEHPHAALRLAGEWERLLATVAWVGEHGGPSVYLRQVDVPGVDTKFVESHRGVVAALLDRHLPPHRVHSQHPASDLARRYGLRPKPEYLRLRSFHPDDGPFTEMTVRVAELAEHPLAADPVFVLENEVTYLAFPPVPRAAVVLGGGYAVSRLAALPWLSGRRVVYWGDLDTHGFAILHRLRTVLPQTQSLLMDADTLLAHRAHWGTEPRPTTTHLPNLTAPEQAVYRDLVTATHGPGVRLEQERVRFSWLRAALASVTGGVDVRLAPVEPGEG